MPDFPSVNSAAQFKVWRADRDQWEGLVRALCLAAGFEARRFAAFAGGTNLVVDLDGEAVLKVFPPIYRAQFVSERAALHHLKGRLAVSVPEILAEGERDGWSWLSISQLPGSLGGQVWPTLKEAEKSVILTDIGRTIAAVQAVPPGDLLAITTAWPDFIRGQIKGCVERHRRQGLPAHLLEDLEALMVEAPRLIPLNAPAVIVTGDWIPENFLLSERSGQWRLSGLIDFGDVRTGFGDYDLLAPSAMLCEGHAGRVKSLFDGYGIDPLADWAALRRRLLILMALHHASDFRNMVVPDWERRALRLEDLELILWPDA